MKTLIITLGILFTSLTSLAGSFDDFVNIIKKGDADSLFTFLDTKVQINIAGRNTTYNKAQAEIILKEFFSKNVVKSFVLKHQGEAGGGSRYGNGNLITSGGYYKLSFFLQKKGKQLWLTEIKLESV